MPLIAILILVLILVLKKPIKAPKTSFASEKENKFFKEMQSVFLGSDYLPSRNNWLYVSRMETNGFTSSLYQNANNPWGMMFPKKRKTTANEEYLSNNKFDWAKYANIKDACRDIILWMDYTDFPKEALSIESHVAEMGKRGYFGTESTDSYLSKVKRWI